MKDDVALPDVGSLVKVFLPGESPWALVVSHTDNGFIGKIDNHLLAEKSEHERARFTKHHFGEVVPLPKLHDYKFGDKVHFSKDENGNWTPQHEPPRTGDGVMVPRHVLNTALGALETMRVLIDDCEPGDIAFVDDGIKALQPYTTEDV